MRSHFFLTVTAFLASFAAGNPIFERAVCKQDNCYRGILQTAAAYKPVLSARLTDCSSFMTTTITPEATTITVTNTATASTTTTLDSNGGAIKRRDPITNFAAQPAYATYCTGTVAYSSGCSCAGITTATITAPTPSVIVTATVTATYTSTATPSATGFYLQVNSENSTPAVNGQCAFFDQANVGENAGGQLELSGQSTNPISPSLFTLDSNGYLYSDGLQAMAEVDECEMISECGTQSMVSYTPAQIAANSRFLVPFVCSLEGTTVDCSVTIGVAGQSYVLSYAAVAGPMDDVFNQGRYWSKFGYTNYGPSHSVSYTAVTDIALCSNVPSTPPVTTVTPSAALPSPFYLQVVSSNTVVNEQCGFLHDNLNEENALSFLGTNGDNCGISIPQFILDINGYLTTTTGYQLGTYITCEDGLNNCGTRAVMGISTADIQFYGSAYYPLVCSYMSTVNQLNCAFDATTADNYNYTPYMDNSGFYVLWFGVNQGSSSGVTFSVIENLGQCAAGC